MSVDTYQCGACGETFDKGWSDEEAAREYAVMSEQYGNPLIPEVNPEDVDLSDKGIVCDPCFKQMAARYKWDIPESSL